MNHDRNAPCPCGSGKKYKKCCFAAESEADAWRGQFRALEGSIMNKLMDYCQSCIGPSAFKLAWHDFMENNDDVPFDTKPYEAVFFHWWVFDWLPEDAAPTIPEGGPLAFLLLSEPDADLNESERAFMQSCLSRPFSFYEVVGVDSGKSIDLRDIITGEEKTIEEKSGSVNISKGDVVYARIIEFGGKFYQAAFSSMLLRPDDKITIIDYREKLLKLTNPDLPVEDILMRFADEFRDLYIKLTDRVNRPRKPVLTNTDGDLLLMHEIVWRIDSVEIIFEKLKTLSTKISGDTDEELLSDAKRDANGTLVEIAFPWLKKGNKKMKDWENTVLGNITIKTDTLTIEVNSEKRAKSVMKEIEKRLGKSAIHLETKISTSEAMWEKMQAAREENEPDEDSESSVPRNAPEIQEFLRKQFEGHWKRWVDEPIPALGNMTPRKAAKNPIGREKLEALLTSFERGNENSRGQMPSVDVEGLRKTLGLS